MIRNSVSPLYKCIMIEYLIGGTCIFCKIYLKMDSSVMSSCLMFWAGFIAQKARLCLWCTIQVLLRREKHKYYSLLWLFKMLVTTVFRQLIKVLWGQHYLNFSGGSAEASLLQNIGTEF